MKGLAMKYQKSYQHNLAEILEHLVHTKELALDTETTGLRPYHGDKAFALIIGTDTFQYYFSVPELGSRINHLSEILLDKKKTWFLHNAKFDLHFLSELGLEVTGKTYCTQTLARIDYNDHMMYSLDQCAKRIGYEKSKVVEEYVSKNKLYTWLDVPGKKTRVKQPHFDRVPESVMLEYACKDVEVTYKLGKYHLENISKKDASKTLPNDTKSNRLLQHIVSMESELTKTCFEAERTGVKVDLDYIREACYFEELQVDAAKKEFTQITGLEFIDSNKHLAKAFESLSLPYPTTEKGNPSFKDEMLKELNSPLAQSIRKYRKHFKKLNTYYRSFEFHADQDGIIHGNFKQAGTKTGRFSFSDPNLQNINKEEDATEEFLVRRSFVPRDGFMFVMIDYDQAEYRLMLEYAEEMGVINQIKSGLDVHTATAELMGVTRKEAKTLNFMLLYGGGAKKLAEALDITVTRARSLMQKYFMRLKNVKKFIKGVERTAKTRGYIESWLGRRFYFKDKNFCYKAPNALIQGGIADVVKTAMVRLDEYLKDKKSRMLLNIHDEILFEVHETEKEIIPKLKEIMETAYEAKHLPLTCGVDFSTKSWADKVEWEHGEEPRNPIQRKSSTGLEEAIKHMVL